METRPERTKVDRPIISAARQPATDAGASGLAARAPEADTRGAPRARATGGWARGLGWFGVGLGAAELLAPSALLGLLGLRSTRRRRRILRALGAREVGSSLALLTSPRPGRWLWSRVAGDLVDLALIGGGALADRRTRADRASVGLAAVTVVTAVDLWASLRRGDPDRGHGATAVARSSSPTSSTTAHGVPISAVITIQRPAAEIYDLWRDFENLPRFMSHLQRVEVRDPLSSRWHASVTGRDALAWDAVIVEDRPSERIAWHSVEGAPFEHTGEVRFVSAPGGRGTEVHLRMNLLPGAGAAAKLTGAANLEKAASTLGRLVRRLPEQLIAADLKRLKQLLETGEITRSDASIHEGMHPARPDGDRGPRAAWSPGNGPRAAATGGPET